MAPSPSLNRHARAEDAAKAAAAAVAKALDLAITTGGHASLAVSGGSTPGPMFDELATLGVDWAHVHLYQVDERVVADGHPDRNATLLQRRLIDHVTLPSGHLHLMPVTDADLEAGARSYAQSLPRLDVVHLGLGPDGHTASWPPQDPVVDSPNLVATTGRFNGYRRMTLTGIAISQAKAAIWLVVGADKRDALAGVLAHDARLPATRALTAKTVLFVDAAAYPG